MRILLVSQHFWPESFRINEMVRSLIQEDCIADILTGQPNYPEGLVFPGHSAWRHGGENYFGLDLFRVPLVPRGRGGALRLAINYFSFLLSASLLGPTQLRRRHYSAILVYATSPILQAIPALIIGWLKQAPVVIWVQDLWPDSLEATGFVKNRMILGIVDRLVRWIYRRADLLLVQSQAFLAPVTAMASGTPVAYYPNSGDVGLGSTREPRETASLPSGFNVMFAGNLGTVQALDTILDAASQLADVSDLRFVIVGSGSRSDWLTTEIAARGLRNVVLLGRFPSSDMPYLFAQASVLLVTLSRSPIFAQTVPSKIQAYLAAGKPIIASLDGEGARVIIEAQAGVSVPAEDASALADAVRSLYATPAVVLDAMGAAGRRFYGLHYDPQLLAARLKMILGEVECRRR